MSISKLLELKRQLLIRKKDQKSRKAINRKIATLLFKLKG